MHIRAETPDDWATVYGLTVAAFHARTEAELVEVLREQVSPLVSLVAERDDAVVGHILFSPVSVSDSPKLKVMGLAPMAVAPGFQRLGIGTSLVRAGFDECRTLGFGAVAVLGHPNYYPRFGFVPASRFGLRCEYDVPDEAFMAIELEPGFLHGASGIVKFHEAFASV